MNKPNICLSMIVKNEVHCIKRCLDSVKPYIKYFIICDTGSTDGTQQIIKDFMVDVPGELYEDEWKDFSYNRNLSLDRARAYAKNSKDIDYILLIDADDYLVVEKSTAFNNLTKQIYTFNFHHGPISYYRIELIHKSVEAKYVGVLHEYLSIPQNICPKILSGVYIQFGANGARSRDPNKYLNDAKIFEKALINEPNNERYIFYCAQSYRDAQIYDKALEYYLERNRRGGWREEVYVSLLEAGKIIINTESNNVQKVENMFLAAHNSHQERAESLAYLSRYFRMLKEYHKAYFYSKIGMRTPKPREALFLEDACYDWWLMDECSVAAFYIGRKDEAKVLVNALLTKDIPAVEKDRIKNNLSFLK